MPFEDRAMRYFIISVLIILTVFGVHWLTVKQSPDNSVESGIHRDAPSTDATHKQSQEDKSVFEAQKDGRNNVPRHE